MPPTPQPQPTPGTPKSDTPKPDKPEEPAPDKIGWKEVKDAGLSKDAIKETKLWKHFTDMSDADISDLETTKPIMIYFYRPYEETSDKKIQNMIRRCGLMEENIFCHEAVRRASVKFHCLWCNFRDDLGEDLRNKYKVTIAPKVLFFDVKGRKVWQLTSTNAKPKGVAGKMNKIAATCKKMIEHMNK